MSNQSMNGIETVSDGVAILENGDLVCNDIYCNNLSSSYIQGSRSTYFTGVTSSIQTQLNNIPSNSYTWTGYNVYTNLPVCSQTPTTGTQITTKAYVDTMNGYMAANITSLQTKTTNISYSGSNTGISGTISLGPTFLGGNGMSLRSLSDGISTSTSTTTLVGFTTTDLIQLYDVSNSVIVSIANAVSNVTYRLLTKATASDSTSIAHYLQYHTPDWYGIWVGPYYATTNSTGYPTAGSTTIGALNYVIWPYSFTLQPGVSLNLYLYGLMNSNTTPYLPTTQYALINITTSMVFDGIIYNTKLDGMAICENSGVKFGSVSNQDMIVCKTISGLSTTTIKSNLNISSGNVYVNGSILDTVSARVAACGLCATLVGNNTFIGTSNIFVGAVNIAGLSVSGAISTGSLSVSGTITGAITFASGVTINGLTNIGSLSCGGINSGAISTGTSTLNVGGTTTLGTVSASSLTVSGTTSFTSLSVSGATNTSPLTVSGATNTSSLTVSEATNTSSLTVSGATNTSSLTVSGIIFVSGSTILNNSKIYLRGSGDTNHVLGFTSLDDGPQLQGYSGGRLGVQTVGGGRTDMLKWKYASGSGSVVVNAEAITLNCSISSDGFTSLTGTTNLTGTVNTTGRFNMSGEVNAFNFTATGEMTSTAQLVHSPSGMRTGMYKKTNCLATETFDFTSEGNGLFLVSFNVNADRNFTGHY